MKVFLGTLLICLSMVLIMFSQMFSGVFWLAFGICILLDGFDNWGVFKKNHKVKQKG